MNKSFFSSTLESLMKTLQQDVNISLLTIWQMRKLRIRTRGDKKPTLGRCDKYEC
jgi:hypothetical protein